MLIACFQCRQQLDVPEDSGGKRVRCLHCGYVIVVPAKSAEPVADETAAPLMSMPSLELDDEAVKPVKTTPAKAPATKLPAQSIPPMPLPTHDAPTPKPPFDALPTPERGSRKRKPAEEPAPAGFRVGRIVGITLGLIVVAVIAFFIAINVDTRPRQPVPPQAQFKPPMEEMKAEEKVIKAMPKLDPPAVIPAALNWKEFQNLECRFKAQFPGDPIQADENVNGKLMTTYRFKQNDWGFSIAHCTVTEKEHHADVVDQHFANLRVHLANVRNAILEREGFLQLNNVHPGREWSFLARDGSNRWHVRTYYVRDGDLYRHYVLTTMGPLAAPRFNVEFDHFFNLFAFVPSLEVARDTPYQDLDDFNNGGRRDNEYTALAVHPTNPVAIVGTTASRLSVLRWQEAGAGKILKRLPLYEVTLLGGKPIDHIAMSPSGQWIAVSTGGNIEYWSDWSVKLADTRSVVPGLHCAFAKNDHLLVAEKDNVKAYAPNQADPIATLAIPDLAVKGVALSADSATLAAWGDGAVAMYHWPTKKLRARIEAHDAPVTVAAFSPDGKTLATGSADRTIKLWHVESRAHRATLKQHAWTVADLAFTPDGKELVSAGLDGMLLAWDLEPAQPTLVWARAHQFPVRKISFDKHGKNCYVTCKQPIVSLDRPPGRQYARQLRTIEWASIQRNPQDAEKTVALRAGLHLPTSSMVHFSADGKTIVMPGDLLDDRPTDRQLRVWDAASATVRAAKPAMSGGSLSVDGRWFAFSKPNHLAEVQVLDVEQNRVMPGAAPTDNQFFPITMFTPDGQSLWIHHRNSFRLYDAQTMQVKKTITLKEANDQRFAVIHPAPDGKTFLVDRSSVTAGLRTRTLHASADGAELPLPTYAPGDLSPFLRLRRVVGQAVEVEDLAQVQSRAIGQQRLALGAAAIAQERGIAVTLESGNDQKLKINVWDMKERTPLLTLPEPNARTAFQTRFSPDGRYVAWTTNAGWTRIVPTEWLLERKSLLPCNPNDVSGP